MRPAQERVRDLVLQAYAEYEETSNGGRFVDRSIPDAAIVAASGIAGALKRDPIRRQSWQPWNRAAG